jgi:subtilisin family serine protease
MHLYDARGERVELDFVGEVPTPGATSRAGVAAVGAGIPSGALASVVAGVFDVRADRVIRSAWGAVRQAGDQPTPAVFRERATGLVRVAGREVVLRFRPGLSDAKRRMLLKERQLELRRRNPLVPDQIVAVDRARQGPELIDVCNYYVESEDVVFATPNFVSEYRRAARAAGANPPPEQWHLENRGLAPGQVRGEDVGARRAWRTTEGRRAVVVAVLDDGVDVDHPNLKQRIWKNPKTDSPDRKGRDFFLPDDHPDHYNPRPKEFTHPYDEMRGNDIHGTPCAGVIAAAGKGAYGIAFRCRVLPVKIFHADLLAEDERVADAIRYAAVNADVLSCSWSGPRSTDVELAVADAGRLGRGGRGAAVFCATGNDDGRVGYPAADPDSIAVGASTDGAVRAAYSNYGPEVDLVAPSSGGAEAIFTTDVANPPGRGFNLGVAERGGEDGLHTNEFGGTSSATPLAAGVGALVLSVLSDLSRDELRSLLQGTAEKIGDPADYGPDGRSDLFGYGRVSAERAVAEATRRGSS